MYGSRPDESARGSVSGVRTAVAVPVMLLQYAARAPPCTIAGSGIVEQIVRAQYGMHGMVRGEVEDAIQDIAECVSAVSRSSRKLGEAFPRCQLRVGASARFRPSASALIRSPQVQLE